MVFITTLQQVAILLIFILIGYLLRKKEVINDSGKKVLAGLLVNLFSPAYSISSLSQQLSINQIAKYGVYFLSGTALTFAIIFIALPFAKAMGKDKMHRNILKYAFAFGNIGYFGYPVVGAVFGETMKALMILFCIPISVGINTYGYNVLTERVDGDALTGQEIKKKSIKKNFRFLYSMPFIGMMVGLVLGLLPITIPKFFISLFDLAGNCQSATAMLLTGTVLASVPFCKLFTSVKPYIIGIIRLLVLPIIVGGALYVVHILGVSGELFQTIFRLSVIVSAMPVGMNVVVYPESCGMDSTEGAKTCFLSYILALGALPLIFTLMQALSAGMV